jgi:hypothetical protein
MKRAKFVGLTSILVLGVVIVLTITIIKTNTTATPHATTMKTPATTAGTPSSTVAPPRAAISVVMPGQTATPQPKGTPTRQATASAHTAASTQVPAAVASSSGNDRYFPAGTPVAAMKSMAANLTKLQVKTILEKQVDANWAVIQSTFGFADKAQAYAFFLGMATRESTLNAGLETGSGAAHSYGPLQAAEPAYANANPSYTPENDVPQMVQYAITPSNFYDPGIAVHMGIRHLIHFAHQAKAAGFSGTDFLRHALIGYNTGWVTTSNQSLLQQYSDEIGALAGWYLINGHLYDSAFTWTGSQAVNRSSPWGWY